MPELVDGFIKWLNSKGAKRLAPEELAYRAYYKLVRIHPFLEGNGRLCRLLANLILLKNNCKPANASLLRHTLARKKDLILSRAGNSL